MPKPEPPEQIIGAIIQAKKRTLNDNVRTNPEFAKRIVQHFSPQFKPGDTFIEPCRGDGAFYDALPDNKFWCEISEGKDYLSYTQPHNWCITNFPWSGKALRPLVRHACLLNTNVVHLIRLHNVFGTKARLLDFIEQGHRLKEVIVCDWKDAFINKAPEGFSLCVIHTQKDYNGDCRWTFW